MLLQRDFFQQAHDTSEINQIDQILLFAKALASDIQFFILIIQPSIANTLEQKRSETAQNVAKNFVQQIGTVVCFEFALVFQVLCERFFCFISIYHPSFGIRMLVAWLFRVLVQGFDHRSLRLEALVRIHDQRCEAQARDYKATSLSKKVNERRSIPGSLSQDTSRFILLFKDYGWFHFSFPLAIFFPLPTAVDDL